MIDRMDETILRSVLETIPGEITVIDANDEVIGWNRHNRRIFKRAHTSMGLNFRECHPRESLDKVERIVREMKEGTRDLARFWIDLKGPEGERTRKVLIEFHALRDQWGDYIGCMEYTMDIEDLRGLQGEKRLLD